MPDDSGPTARAIANFPLLTEMTGGLRGLWIIGGATGTGKSTTATNILVNVVGPNFPGLVLDMENDTKVIRVPQGIARPTREIGDRIVSAYGKDCPALDHIRGYRDHDDFEYGVRLTPPPAVLVIDHLQNLAKGSDVDQQRASINTAVRKCQDWVLAGYTVILLSQQSRRTYGYAPNPRPTLRDFKDTGNIEASAFCALHVWYPNEGDAPRICVVKLRYGKLPAHELLLRRDGWRLHEDQMLPLPARGERAPVAPRPSACPVLRVLTKTPGLTPTEITTVLKRTRDRMSVRTVERRLREHLAAKRASKDDGGRYNVGPMRQIR